MTLSAQSSAPIPIQNPSFEATSGMLGNCGTGCKYSYDTGIPGWTISGNGGSFQPTSVYLTIPPQDGITVAYSQGGTIGQVLTTALQANSTYTLSVDVGHRLDGYATNYTISLLAGGTILKSFSANSSAIAPGTLATQTLTYSSGPTVNPGQMLAIQLYSASDQGDYDNVSLTVAPSTPALTSADNATFTIGVAGSFTVTATGTPAPTFSETGTLPSGVTLNATSGVLSGTPAAGGTFPITITAQNGVLPNATQSFTLTVDSPPVITSASSATFASGTAGTFAVTAAGTPVPILSETGTLPPGVTFNSATGILSGTPTTGGTYPITISAQNGILPSASQSFTLTVNSAPAITSGNSATFTSATAGSFTVTAIGVPTPTFTESGTLPAGVTFNPATGVLSGTPTSGGTYAVTITAQNGVLPNASQSFTLSVNAPPAITSASSATFAVGAAGAFTAAATGLPAPVWSATGALPSGVTLNATTGVLSGTPASGGTYPITLTAQNGILPNATQGFMLTVTAPPAITSANSATIAAGAAATFTAVATGTPAPTWSESGTLPNGVTLDPVSGILSGTATIGGIYPITLTAQNGVLPNAAQSFTLTVTAPPAITSANSAAFTAGIAGTFSAVATGTPSPNWSEIGALPNGVTFDAGTGILSGTATVGGTYPITITAQNGVQPNATQSFTLTVNAPPSITSANSVRFSLGAAGAFALVGTGNPVPTWSETGALPSGVTFSASTGVLSGTPTVGGTYPITITAQNGIQPNASQVFTLTVTSPPAITSASTATFTAGTAGTFTPVAIGTPTPTWSESGALPNGVTFDPVSGILSGTAAAGGSYPITITAQNGNLPNASQSFTLIVNSAPSITSASAATFTAGVSGTFTVTAAGTPSPTWSESGTLPDGVTFNSATGILSGTPTTAGTFQIAIAAQNGILPNATQNFTLTVNAALAITSARSATFTVGTSGTFTVVATGTPTATLSESGALPGGVTFDPGTGILSGTPTTGGKYRITFAAQNGVAQSVSQNFTLTVNAPPAITSANTAVFTVGTPGTFTLTATGTPSPTWSESGALPSGVAFNPATGVLAGTPTASGHYAVTFTAQNGLAPNASQYFTLNIDSTQVSIPIQNPSFETTVGLVIGGCGLGCNYSYNSGIPGWTITGPGGSFQPTATYLALPAQDGQTVAYSMGGTIGQVLTTTLLANSTYTLSVDVGHRMDGYATNYTIELLAGGTILNTLTGNSGNIPAGAIATQTLTYTSGTSVTSGQLLEIRLIAAGNQGDFDDVSLTAVTMPATLPVQNPSFETTAGMVIGGCGPGCNYSYNSGIPGWTIMGGGGSFQPTANYLTLPPQDGQTVAYSMGGTIDQVLPCSLKANSSYALSVDVGHRLDGFSTTYTIQLLAGGNVLNQITGDSGNIAAGSLVTQTLNYTSGATVTPGQLLEIRLVSTGNQGDYDNVSLTETPSAPTITAQPQNQMVVAGSIATFAVTVTGASPLSFQWQRNGVNISGANSASYSAPVTTAGDNGTQYSVVIANPFGVTSSNIATLTVAYPPSISAGPASQTLAVGEQAVLSVSATGSQPLSYQWFKNGISIPNATSATYTTPPLSAGDNAEQFQVVVTNSLQSIPSNGATLTVIAHSSPATYYVDYQNGSDTNNGLSESSPWQNAPGMAACAYNCGAYTLQPGDRVIFKGGTVWPAGSFPMTIGASGTSANPIYFGVDSTWFAGNSWSRPIFDLYEATWSAAPVLVNSASYVTLDNLEIRNEEIFNNTWGVFTSGISVNGGSNVTIQNCYVHGWSIHNPQWGSDTFSSGGVAFYNGSTSGTVKNCVIDASPEADSGTGIYGGSFIQGNIVENTPNGIIVDDPTASVSGNQVFNVTYSVDPRVNSNALFVYTSGKVYNNTVHDLVAGAAAMVLEAANSQTGNTQSIYNNLVWNVGDDPPITIASDNMGPASTSNQSIFNNTLYGGASSGCVNVLVNFYSPTNLWVQNNQCISDLPGNQAWCWNNANGNFNCGLVTNVTFGNNVSMSSAAALAQGYTVGNSFQPSLASSITVGAGLNLTSSCTSIGAPLCGDRLGVARPAGSIAWDVGAYQFQSGVSVLPAITTQPLRQAVAVGQPATFAVIATGAGPLAYQWMKNGNAIAGANLSTYTTPGTVTSDDGSTFTVLVSNAAGSVLSGPATLSINTSPGQLVPSGTIVSFGPVDLGASSSVNITLTNMSTSYVTISGTSISGPGLSASGVPSGTILAPGQFITLTVLFAPSGSGAVSGNVQIFSDAVGSPLTIPVSGAGVTAAHSVSVTWNASTSTVFGYNVYRSTNQFGYYSRLNSLPITTTQYTDLNVVAGQTYFYWVTSVDANTLESTLSIPAAVTVPSP
jgi:hypothetical protein